MFKDKDENEINGTLLFGEFENIPIEFHQQLHKRDRIHAYIILTECVYEDIMEALGYKPICFHSFAFKMNANGNDESVITSLIPPNPAFCHLIEGEDAIERGRIGFRNVLEVINEEVKGGDFKIVYTGEINYG